MFSIIVGTLVVLVALSDVFFTVLFPASGRGPVRKPLAYLVWRLFRFAGQRTSGARRSAWLSYGGPAQILVTMVVWASLLVLGWALIYLPALGEQIRATAGQPVTGFATAVYFSGMNLTTLGTGDIVASSTGYRLLTMVQSATGFAVMTMVITYFLSVYSALPNRNAFAMKLHHRTCGTDDAAVLVAVLVDDQPAAVREQLTSTAEFLRHTTQTHRFYPVLRYFHYRQDYYALPRLMLTSLEAIALIRSALDPHRYADLLHASVLGEVSLAAQSLLDELIDTAHDAPPQYLIRQWRHRYAEAASTMADRGVALRTDAHAADEYVELRSQWDAPLAALAGAMMYQWEQNLRCPPEPARSSRVRHRH